MIARISLSTMLIGSAMSLSAAAAETVSFQPEEDRVGVLIGGRRVADYVFRDEKTTRPYFAHVKTREGVQVTRNHPPQPGDAQDHATFHPGIWMAFGDLGGADNWRMKAPVVHDRFVMSPKGGEVGRFVVENVYKDNGGNKEICRETFECRVQPVPEGYVLHWSSRFRSVRGDFYFGDQEEMGLAIRVASPLAVKLKGKKQSGRILDSEGRRNESQVWGKSARWVDYGGVIGDTPVGMTIFSHADNPRPSWLHARDYGFVASNLFGRQALTRGPKSKIVVAKGKEFHLRYGVLIRSGADSREKLENAYRRYIRSSNSP